jgi:DNA-binding transcriptional LysR family regulator
VEQGMGISIVSALCLTGDEKVAHISLKDYFPDRGYGIVLRRGKFLSPQAKRFIEILDPDFFDQEEEAQKEAV